MTTLDDLNDNKPSANGFGKNVKADGHCGSAMLLVESLLHGLVAKSVITVADAIEIVDIAADVKDEVEADGHGSQFHSERQDILASISASLRQDLPQI